MLDRPPDVPRLSAKESLILEQLIQGGEQYGLQLVAGSNGRLKRGTVYVTLGRMEDKRYLTSRAEQTPEGAGGLPRRLYTVSPFGLRVWKAWRLMLKHLSPGMAR